MHEYEVMSMALYYKRSTSHNCVVFALYRTYSLIFFACTFRRPVQNFSPLRQYDITGLIYAKTFSSIIISASENPCLHVDCCSISYILRISCQTILANSPLDTFKDLWKTIAFSAFQPLRLERAPLPPKTMFVCF